MLSCQFICYPAAGAAIWTTTHAVVSAMSSEVGNFHRNLPADAARGSGEPHLRQDLHTTNSIASKEEKGDGDSRGKAPSRKRNLSALQEKPQVVEVRLIIQWNLSIAVTIGAKFFGCYRQVAALMR